MSKERIGRIMFCEKCGKEIDNNMKFCPYCGKVVQAEAEENVAVDEEVNFASETETAEPDTQLESTTIADFTEDNQENHKGIIIAAAIVVIIAVGVAIWAMSNRATKGEIGDISFELDKTWELQEKGSSDEMLIYTNKEKDDIVCEIDLIKKDIIDWQITFEENVPKLNAEGSPAVNITTVSGKNAVKYAYNFENEGNLVREVNVHFSYNNQLYVLRVYTTGDGATLDDEMQGLIQKIEFTKEKKAAKGEQNFEGMYYSELSSRWAKTKNGKDVYYVPIESNSSRTYGLVISKQTATTANETVSQILGSNTVAAYNIFVGDKVATLYATTKAYKGGVYIDMLIIPDGGNSLCIMLATTADGAYEDDFFELLDTIEFQ